MIAYLDNPNVKTDERACAQIIDVLCEKITDVRVLKRVTLDPKFNKKFPKFPDETRALCTERISILQAEAMKYKELQKQYEKIAEKFQQELTENQVGKESDPAKKNHNEGGSCSHQRWADSPDESGDKDTESLAACDKGEGLMKTSISSTTSLENH